LYSDWADGLIYRLYEKGDKELISNLFTNSKWADGAGATGLSGYLTKSFAKDPRFFLLKLKEQPKEVKHEVYNLFFRDEMLTEEEIKRIKAQLQGIPRKSEEYEIAQEMYDSIKKM
jgi:hypothetical protein